MVAWRKNAQRDEQIIEALKSGEAIESIAARFGLSKVRIYKIRRAVLANGQAVVVAGLDAGEPVDFTGGVEVVTSCRHNAADLLRLAAMVRGEEAAPQVAAKECQRCVRRGERGHNASDHINGDGACRKCRDGAVVNACGAFDGGAARRPGRGDWQRDFTVGTVKAKYLGNGASRVAFDLGCGQHIVKVAYCWEEQGAAEVKRFRQFDAAARAFVARLFAFARNGTVIVAEKVGKEPDLQRRKNALIRKAANDMHLGDLHDANIGWRGDQPVVLDYGL